MQTLVRPITHRRRALLAAGLAFVIVLVLWNVRQLDFLLYPMRLFVTFVHESGHGLAALITGGHFERFEVFSNGAGVALTAGGSRLLILPAGYLGAALFGAVVFYLANTIPYSRVIAGVLGVYLIAFSLLFTDFFTTAFLVGVLMGIGLLVVSAKASPDITLILLNVLSILTGLNAVLDLVYVFNNSGASLGAVRNDAAAFAIEMGGIIPAGLWAGVWALIAILMLGAAVWFSVFRPRRL
ncbi:MAG: M50 family metallopeptidase [bacterium]|nr:M50 family metallopeptidase [bacterium]